MSNRAAVLDRTAILRQRLDALVSELTELEGLRDRVRRAEAAKVSTRRPSCRGQAVRGPDVNLERGIGDHLAAEAAGDAFRSLGG